MERGWTKELMKDDPLFNRLANVRRDHANLGRMFLAWTVVNGKPQIEALFKVDRFGLSGEGMNMTIAMATAAGKSSNLFRIRHLPVKVPGLDLYLWLPNFGEVRYVPTDHKDPHSHFFCSVPLLVKYQHPPGLSQVEERLYFASKNDFATLWPAHDF